MRRQELLGPNKMERQQERNKKDDEQELQELSKKDEEQQQQVPSMTFQRCAECTKISDD